MPSKKIIKENATKICSNVFKSGNYTGRCENDVADEELIVCHVHVTKEALIMLIQHLRHRLDRYEKVTTDMKLQNAVD